MSRKRPPENQFALDFEPPAPVPDNHSSEGSQPMRSAQKIDSHQPTEQRPPLASLDDTEALLSQWQQAGWLRPLDTGFARLMRSLTEEQGQPPAPLLLLLAALISHQVGRGHVCIDLNGLLAEAETTLALPPETPVAGRPGEAPSVTDATLPTPAEILAEVSLTDVLTSLESSSAVSDGSQTSPLVLNESRLYLRRFWRYEQHIVAAIEQRLKAPSLVADPDSDAARTLALALQQLFAPGTEVDYQKLACALAARNRFAIVTGGPGTGKTTTVVKLLAALQSVAGTSAERAGRKYRIRLAAPTGKAAARLNESIANTVSGLPFDHLPGNVGQDDIPTRVTTLHRLLGSRPDSRSFRHNRQQPLLVDILVIDEASMVDVDLMASVVEALPAACQLILLGDKDQLASVDAGAVLGELCQRAAAAHYTPDTARWLQSVTGEQLPASLTDAAGQPLDQAVAMLRKSHRFGADSGIGRLAEAVNRNALDQAMLRQCREGHFADVILLDPEPRQPDPGARPETSPTLLCRHALSGSPEAFQNRGQGRTADNKPIAPPVGYRHYLDLLGQHPLTVDSPRADWDQLARTVLAAFGRFQLLCALRRGPWGVEGLNELIARHLLAAGLITRADGWYGGRPVLVTGNDYNLGLMNGDIGITFTVPWDVDPAGQPKDTLRVAFPSAEADHGIRWIAPSRLQQLETVYAMTVHKSQGSEFDHTCLVLPDRLSPVMTRELIYTGITRARNWFSLVAGDNQTLLDSVNQQVVRASGLAHRFSQT